MSRTRRADRPLGTSRTRAPGSTRGPDPSPASTRPHRPGFAPRTRGAVAATFGCAALRRVATVAVLALTACGAASDGGTDRFLSIGTAGTGGIYYPVGGALANRLTERDSVRRFTAEVSGGSVENLNRVLNGDIDLGMAIGTTIHRAYHGDDADPRARALRVVAPLYPNVTHVLATAGAGARSVAEFGGLRVSVGAAGSGTEQVSRELLSVFGLDYDDVDERFLSFAESSAALRDGAIDAAILSVGYPASAVLEATTNGDVRLVALDSDAIRTLVERHPYYSPDTIPAGSYPGVTADVPTVGTMNWIVADSAIDAGVVTELLTILRDEREGLAQVHGIMRQLALDALARPPIPLHDAAERWMEGEAAEPSRPGG